MSTAPGDLLLALSDPGFFPDRPDLVERRETPEHVVFTPHGIEIVDCVEFDPALRRVDVAADLALLVMDLTALGAPRAAAQLVEAYRATGGDPGDDDFLAFRAAGRAWTRGKVALFRSETEDSDRAAAAELQARRLVSLADGSPGAPACPCYSSSAGRQRARSRTSPPPWPRPRGSSSSALTPRPNRQPVVSHCGRVSATDAPTELRWESAHR